MSKITADNRKWGKLTVATHGLTFIGEELVDLNIVEDDLNPSNNQFICINGNQIWLGTEGTLKVPASVADNYNKSRQRTSIAKKNMKKTIEIKS